MSLEKLYLAPLRGSAALRRYMIKPQYQELALKLSAKKMMAYGYNALRQIPKSEKHARAR